MTPLRDKGNALLPVALSSSHALPTESDLVIPSTLPPNTDAYSGTTSLRSLKTVVRQLQHLLPGPIQYDHQDKVATDSLLLAMTAEAASFNDTISFVQRWLDYCISYLQGKLPLKTTVCQVLSLLMSNSVPIEWARMLGLSSPDLANFSLITFLQLLQKRRMFLGKCLDEGMVPRVMDPCMLSRPSAITALLQQRQRDGEDQVVAAQVRQQALGIARYITNLALHVNMHSVFQHNCVNIARYYLVFLEFTLEIHI